jgi:hypothetical protein
VLRGELPGAGNTRAEALSIRRLEGSRWQGGRVWSYKLELFTFFRNPTVLAIVVTIGAASASASIAVE